MRFFRILNVLRHPITEISVQTAKRRYRKRHAYCAVCGLSKNILTGRKNDIHHVVPVHADPTLATNPDNFITLCRTHHFIIGHFYNWRKWNGNIRNTAINMKLFITDERLKHIKERQ